MRDNKLLHISLLHFLSSTSNMESSPFTLINKKWMLCTFASFLSLFFLSLFLNQKLQLTAILSTFNEEKAKGTCDFFEGKWFYDGEAYPLYHGHECPFLDAQVNCQKNGRPDSGYEHWRWEAYNCEIPRFNASYMLGRLRGKRLAMIGDSLNRNQWESLVCLLYSSIRPSGAAVKINGNDMVFQAMVEAEPLAVSDYDFSLEFFWSPFLVRLDKAENGTTVLKIEELSASASQWRGADVMVFNTGHWWTHGGKTRAWNYFESKGKLLEMEVHSAFDIALKTWAQWVDRTVDGTKTTIFFRSFSPEHKRESMQWCYNQTRPITNEKYVQWFPKHMVSTLERTIEKMRTPVTYLNITRLSEGRPDAHTSVYTVRQWKLLTKEQREKPGVYADCSHWCLPGLPDTWNALLYASLFRTDFLPS